MKIQITEDTKQKIISDPRFMYGVHKGYYDSSLPTEAITNFSRRDSLKDKYKNDNAALTQDLLLRMGTQVLSKATIGGLTYGGIRMAQQYLGDENIIDPESRNSYAAAIAPSIAAAWVGSNKLQEYLPSAHKKIFKDRSIYK